MGKAGRIFVAGFLFALICIPVAVGFLHHSQTVVSASTHKILIPSSTQIPTVLPNIMPTSVPIDMVSIVPQPEADRPLDETPTPSPTPMPTANPQDDRVWSNLAQCESHGNWTDDTGNGYFGGLQFSQSAWESVGGTGKPSDASKDEQIAKAKLLQQSRGWSPWGACSRQLGLE